MKDVVFAVPGDLSTPTGGYVYDRRIIEELRASGWHVNVMDLGDGFPDPTSATLATAHLRLAAVPRGRRIVIDGLAFGVMPDTAQALQQSHRLVALVHHPLALETGLRPMQIARLQVREQAALTFARIVITTSATTARVLVEEFAVPEVKLRVVLPGAPRVAAAPRPPDGIVNLLAVGSIVPRKGYDVLIAALGKIADLPWRLTIAGDPGRDPATARELDDQIASLNLGKQVSVIGVVASDRLGELYSAADLFVLPSRYEGYGMAYAEAIAHGVPVVGTTAGAIPEVVPAGAGVLVQPDDIDELCLVLMKLMGNAAERARLAAGARTAAATLPTWAEAGAQFARVLDEIP